MMAAKRHASDEKDQSRGVLYYLGLGLSGGLLALVVLLGVMAIVVPAVGGATPMTVLTGSMEPNLPPGTLVIVRPVETQDVRVGDVITYRITPTESGVVTHRVTDVAKSSDGIRSFTTKGDNNDLADAAAVAPRQLVGTLWYSIPWIGYVNNLVGANRAWLVPVVVFAFLLYAGYAATRGAAAWAQRHRRVRVSERSSVAE